MTGRRDGRRAVWAFPPVVDTVGGRVLNPLRAAAEDLGVTPACVAIAWLLSRPEVTSVIVGASSVDQLGENLEAAALELDEAHLVALNDASSQAPLYPRWWDTAMGVS